MVLLAQYLSTGLYFHSYHCSNTGGELVHIEANVQDRLQRKINTT